MEITNGLSAVQETVTVIKAKQMLEKNQMNRPVNERNLQQLIMDMKRDNFQFTGDPVQISKKGNLLNGQHRLLAIVKTGIPQKMFIVRGLEEDSFKYMDTGRTRKASDVLGIEGYKNPARIAAVIRFIIIFKRGQYGAAVNSLNRGRSIITNADVSEFASKNKSSLDESIKEGFNKDNKLLSGQLLSALHYILKGINKTDADEFVSRISVGDTKDSPIWLLRQQLTADLRSTKKMGKPYKLALICKTWNAFRTGKKISNLKWDSVREAFPKPI